MASRKEASKASAVPSDGSENLNEHVDGYSIDLSMQGRDVVPMAGLARRTLVTTVDMSKNRLVRLPSDFGTVLRHLVRLDLSQNQLVELPESFGELCNLRKLDLLNNHLR